MIGLYAKKAFKLPKMCKIRFNWQVKFGKVAEFYYICAQIFIRVRVQ